MALVVFYVGAVAPEKLEMEVPSDGVLDMSTVSAVELQVLKPGGNTPDEEFTWTASITAAAPDVLTLEHPFIVSDIDRVGPYRVVVVLTTPGGPERTEPDHFLGLY